MHSTAEMIEIVCPECGEAYADWYRPDVGSSGHAVCPTCGYDLAFDLAAHEDGGWLLAALDDDDRDA